MFSGTVIHEIKFKKVLTERWLGRKICIKTGEEGPVQARDKMYKQPFSPIGLP